MTRVPGKTSPWPFRCALAAALAAVPLVLFGGSVTTIGAGMAVEGWLIAEGHFLVFFPLDSWMRDTATFVEHTHRLFGVLVGLFASATVVAAFLSDERTRARALALFALVLVCGQGALGGFRVLENSPGLAFVHGALAQAVLAVLGATALYLAPRWRERRAVSMTPGLSRLATATALVVYAQVVVGAWYRHALRPHALPESGPRFLIHVGLAFLVTALVVALGRALLAEGSPRARSCAKGLFVLFGLQVLLGLLAFAGYRPGAVGPLEWGLSIAHVLGGGLLLFQAIAVRMVSAPLADTLAVEGRPALGGELA